MFDSCSLVTSCLTSLVIEDVTAKEFAYDKSAFICPPCVKCFGFCQYYAFLTASSGKSATFNSTFGYLKNRINKTINSSVKVM